MTRKVVRIDQGLVDRLAAEIEPFLERGQSMRDTERIGDVDLWRRAARQAARENGWKIRTGVTPDRSRVWAVREDREITEEEMRAAVDAVTLSIDQAVDEARRSRLRLVDDQDD